MASFCSRHDSREKSSKNEMNPSKKNKPERFSHLLAYLQIGRRGYRIHRKVGISQHVQTDYDSIFVKYIMVNAGLVT